MHTRSPQLEAAPRAAARMPASPPAVRRAGERPRPARRARSRCRARPGRWPWCRRRRRRWRRGRSPGARRSRRRHVGRAGCRRLAGSQRRRRSNGGMRIAGARRDRAHHGAGDKAAVHVLRAGLPARLMQYQRQASGSEQHQADGRPGQRVPSAFEEPRIPPAVPPWRARLSWRPRRITQRARWHAPPPRAFPQPAKPSNSNVAMPALH
jgi:hypothetical protein